MGAEYDLCLSSPIDLEELSERIAAFNTPLTEDLSYKDGVYSFSNQFFSVSLSTPSDNLEEIQKSRYGIDCNVLINFRLVTSRDSESTKEMVGVVDKLMEMVSGDLALEFNNEFPVILREDGQVFINHEYDDGSNFPFDKLTVPVKVVHVPCE